MIYNFFVFIYYIIPHKYTIPQDCLSVSFLHEKMDLGEESMLAERLKYTRERKGLTQVELAKMFGVSGSTLSGWETRKDIIPFKYVLQYANLYHYSLDYLFGLTEENKDYENIDIDLKKIGRNVRIIRKLQHDSQKDLAFKLNYSISCISHYETGKKLISTTFVYGFSKLYRFYSIDKIVGRKLKQKEISKVM